MRRRTLLAAAAAAAASVAGPATAQEPGWKELLDELSRKVYARDPTVIEMFTDNAVLIGSASGERAEGAAQLKHLIGAVYGLPVRMTWTWSKISSGVSGDLGWMLAEGEFIQETATRTHKAPYDVSLILERQGGRWRIRKFHGSEPHVPAPSLAAATPR